MHRGYIRLWRCIQNNHLWEDTPFDRARAWIDLVMLANHTAGFMRKRGIKFEIKRGQVGWSERDLAERWKWSRGKVKRFLDELEEDEQINQGNGPQNINVTSLITITNYELYQPLEPQTGHKRAANSTIDNNDKKKKKEPIEHFPNAQEIFEKCWSIYPRKEGKIEAQKHFKASVKSAEEARELFIAIQRYKELVADREMQHVKQGNSFFYNWRDYATETTC